MKKLVFLLVVFFIFVILFKPTETSALAITVNSPMNQTYNIRNIILEVTTDVTADWISDSFDGGQQIVECYDCYGYTRYDLFFQEGVHRIRIYASVNNVVSTVDVIFTVASGSANTLGSTGFASMLSGSTPVINCTDCSVGNCKCSITNCASGLFRVYTVASCTGIWQYDSAFSNSAVTWIPLSSGNYSLLANCPNGVKSACTKVTIGGGTTTTTTTTTSSTTTTAQTTTTSGTTGTTGGGGGDGGGGGGGIGYQCRPENHICSDSLKCCINLYCVNGICRKSPGGGTTVTTTTTSQTTATAEKTNCPFECCTSEQRYYDRPCGEGYECADNNCNLATETTTTEYPEEPSLNQDLLIWVLLLIIIPAFVIIFIFNRKEGEWKKLYFK